RTGPAPDTVLKPVLIMISASYDAHKTPLRDNNLAHRFSLEMLDDSRIRQRDLSQPLLGRVSRYGEPRAQLAVDLHRDDNLLRLRDSFIKGWPAGGDDAVGMPERFPQFLRHVRRKRRNHLHQGLD